MLRCPLVALLLLLVAATPASSQAGKAPPEDFARRYAELVAARGRVPDARRLNQLFALRWSQQLADAPDFATMLERALVHAHRAVDQHEVLQKVLETEPERLLPQLTQSAPLVQASIRGYFAERLAGEELRPGVDPDEAADWLSRMGLSFVISGGSWDLTDPAAVRRLVREEGLLVGGSAGLNVVAAVRLAARGDLDGPVVTVLPDGWDRYRAPPWMQGW
jgi:hypothetical protein